MGILPQLNELLILETQARQHPGPAAEVAVLWQQLLIATQLMYILLLCGACTRVAPPQRIEASSLVPACPLQVSASWPILAYDDRRQAVRDFERATGSPYAALYIRNVAGKGAQTSRCIRVVQRSAIQFRRYAYQAQGVDSADYHTAGWPAAFTRLPPGYYEASLCFTDSTDVAYWHLVVKQGPELTFSLGLESRQYERLAAAEQARLALTFDLIKLLHP